MCHHILLNADDDILNVVVAIGVPEIMPLLDGTRIMILGNLRTQVYIWRPIGKIILINIIKFVGRYGSIHGLLQTKA